jgi:hypothetical protein
MTGTPRWEYYIYVNTESIECILNPILTTQITGNFLILVQYRSSLCILPDEDDPEQLGPEDEDDMSFKMIAMDRFVEYYSWLAATGENWYESHIEWFDPPHVHGRKFEKMAWVEGGEVWWQEVVDEDRKGRNGLDVYGMLKQMYGKGHWRSPAFQEMEAKTNVQRLRGYIGGFAYQVPVVD